MAVPDWLKINRTYFRKSEACWTENKMGSYRMPINCKWVKMKCNAMRTLGIFNSCEKKLNFFRQFKVCKRCLKDMEIYGALSFRKNTHFQDISSIQATLRVYDESVQQVSD